MGSDHNKGFDQGLSWFSPLPQPGPYQPQAHRQKFTIWSQSGIFLHVENEKTARLFSIGQASELPIFQGGLRDLVSNVGHSFLLWLRFSLEYRPRNAVGPLSKQ